MCFQEYLISFIILYIDKIHSLRRFSHLEIITNYLFSYNKTDHYYRLYILLSLSKFYVNTLY